MKVWLADQEVEQLLEVASDIDVEHYLAIDLRVRCGLRSAEVLDVTTRTLRRWVKKCALNLADENDDGWRYLSFHDLRRTWATSLGNKIVDELVLMEWGGWEDVETFLEHYQGAYSPEAQRRERSKVNWL